MDKDSRSTDSSKGSGSAKPDQGKASKGAAHSRKLADLMLANLKANRDPKAAKALDDLTDRPHATPLRGMKPSFEMPKLNADGSLDVADWESRVSKR